MPAVINAQKRFSSLKDGNFLSEVDIFYIIASLNNVLSLLQQTLRGLSYSKKHHFLFLRYPATDRLKSVERRSELTRYASHTGTGKLGEWHDIVHV